MIPRSLIIIGFLIAVLAGRSGFSADIDHDSAFFQGMRDRGLYSLLESTLTDRLEREDSRPATRALFCLELARTLTEHAEHLIGEPQSDAWDRAIRAIELGHQQNDLSRWGDELKLQKAKIAVSRANSTLQQVRLTPQLASSKTEAISQQRKAVDELKKFKNELEQDAKLVLSRHRANSAAISPYQHNQLERETELLLAETYANLVELGDTKLIQRTTPLSLSRRLADSLSRGIDGDQIVWRARLLLVRCDRLSGSIQAGLEKLDGWDERIPTDVRKFWIAERVKLLLNNEQPDLALELLFTRRQQTGVLRGELALLELQMLGELWELADKRGEKELASDLFDRLELLAKQAKKDIGGIWSWRCLVYLNQMNQAKSYGVENAEQILEAQSHYRQGDIATAERLYRQIAKRAETESNANLAGEMLFTVGSLALQQQQWTKAGEAFHSVDASFPTSNRAADGHLMWAYCLGKSYESAPTKSNRELYTSALEEHLERFRDSRTAGDAHLMLGQLEEKRLQVTKAVKHYLSVSTSHARSVEADLGALRCYQKILDRLAELNQPQEAWRREGIQLMSGRIQTYAQSDQLRDDQLRALLELAKLILADNPVDYEKATLLLGRVDRATETSSSDLRSDLGTEANQLRILALAGEGKIREAEALVSRLSAADTDQVLELLDGLSQMAEGVNRTQANRIGELQLKASLALKRREASFSEEQRKRLNVCLAQSYSATEHSKEAIDLYRQMVDRDPEDLSLRESFAIDLTKCGTQSCLYEAIPQWKTIVGSHSQGSIAWLRARKELIRCLIGTDQFKDARSLLGKTKILYPDLGNESLKHEYELLEMKLK